MVSGNPGAVQAPWRLTAVACLATIAARQEVLGVPILAEALCALRRCSSGRATSARAAPEGHGDEGGVGRGGAGATRPACDGGT